MMPRFFFIVFLSICDSTPCANSHFVKWRPNIYIGEDNDGFRVFVPTYQRSGNGPRHVRWRFDEGLYTVVPKSKKKEIESKMELKSDMLWQRFPDIELCTSKARAWHREVCVNNTCCQKHEDYEVLMITVTPLGVFKLMTTIHGAEGKFKRTICHSKWEWDVSDMHNWCAV